MTNWFWTKSWFGQIENISKVVNEGNLTKSILIFGVNRYHPSGYILCIKTKSIILKWTLFLYSLKTLKFSKNMTLKKLEQIEFLRTSFVDTTQFRHHFLSSISQLHKMLGLLKFYWPYIECLAVQNTAELNDRIKILLVWGFLPSSIVDTNLTKT